MGLSSGSDAAPHASAGEAPVGTTGRHPSASAVRGAAVGDFGVWSRMVGNRVVHPVMFTVDVERDWAGTDLRGVTEALPRLLELLAHYGATATFFVVADLTAAVQRALPVDCRHEVGSHTVSHRSLRALSASEVDHEVGASKRILEAAGFRVGGFRAPYFARSVHLEPALVRHGYQYDASFGSLYPRPDRGRGRRDGVCRLHEVPASTLKDGWSPFSLTYLRLYHPLGLGLVPERPGAFSCHLHELVEGTPGWTKLPAPARWLHRRGSGRTAWRILEGLLRREDLRFISCREGLEEASR